MKIRLLLASTLSLALTACQIAAPLTTGVQTSAATQPQAITPAKQTLPDASLQVVRSKGHERLSIALPFARAFRAQAAQSGALDRVTITISGEGITPDFTAAHTVTVDVNDGTATAEIADIPALAGALRVVTAQGYDIAGNRLSSFVAKGVYRSGGTNATITLSLGRRSLLTGLIVEGLIASRDPAQTGLDLAQLQTVIDALTGYEAATGSFVTDPQRFAPASLIAAASDGSLFEADPQIEIGALGNVVLTLATAAPRAYLARDIILSLNDPTSLPLGISRLTPEGPRTITRVSPGTWTLTARYAPDAAHPEGELIGTTTVTVDFGGNVTSAPLSLEVAGHLGAFIVNSTLSDAQQYPAVARNDAGQTVVVWQSPDGDQEGIFAQRYAASGDRIGTELRVNDNTTGSQKDATVGMDAEGNFIVAWQSNSYPGGSGLDIVYRRFDAGDNSFENESLLNVAQGTQISPALAMNADGDVIAAWLSAGHSGGLGSDVMIRRYEAGSGFSSEMIVNDLTGNQGGPAVAIAANGDFVVSWESTDHDGGDSADVFTRRYDAGSSSFESPVMQASTGVQYFSAVAMDADGDFAVAWTSYDHVGGEDKDVFLRRYDAGTGNFEPETIIHQATGDQALPALGMSADGDFVIAWYSLGHAGGNQSDIMARRFDAESGEFSREAIVNATLGVQAQPAVAMSAAGDFVIGWDSYAHENGDHYDIFAQFYNALGASL